MRATIAGLVFCLVLGGCASGGGSAPGDRRLITESEIAAANVHTAFDVVQRYRPEWLRTRGPQSMTAAGSEEPVVYINNNRHGELATLRSISTQGIREIRYYSGPEATQRWGTGLPGGVIAITIL